MLSCFLFRLNIQFHALTIYLDTRIQDTMRLSGTAASGTKITELDRSGPAGGSQYVPWLLSDTVPVPQIQCMFMGSVVRVTVQSYNNSSNLNDKISHCLSKLFILVHSNLATPISTETLFVSALQNSYMRPRIIQCLPETFKFNVCSHVHNKNCLVIPRGQLQQVSPFPTVCAFSSHSHSQSSQHVCRCTQTSRHCTDFISTIEATDLVLINNLYRERSTPIDAVFRPCK